MQIVLSYGMGVDSTAILLRWIEEPGTCPCRLDELVVVTAQTGDEYEDTRQDVEAYILPRLRANNIRFVQVARNGHQQQDGIAVLSDSREPERLFIEGRYRLSDELRAAGTVPQFAGEHTCSLKFKAWVIERWLREHLPQPIRHAFGYNAEETRRVAKSEAAIARRIAFGFNADETRRVTRARHYDTPSRQSFYPLLDWGWTREKCLDYIQSVTGVRWRKSACVYCPFNSLKADSIERHREHPHQVADALLLEHLSLSLNPRGQLYRDQALVTITAASRNAAAIEAFRHKLDASLWALYRVRRIYRAGKDNSGIISAERKGNVLRAVEQIGAPDNRTVIVEQFNRLPEAALDPVEQHGITYAYRLRRSATYPTKEEFFVALPAVVESKARYGLEWFEEQWQAAQLQLFD